jgi:hypothetical protein
VCVCLCVNVSVCDAEAGLAAVGFFQTISSSHLPVGHSHEDIGAGLRVCVRWPHGIAPSALVLIAVLLSSLLLRCPCHHVGSGCVVVSG